MSATTKGALQPKPSGFQWTVKRFFADCKNVGDYYKSPMFPIHYAGKVTKWYLEAYPKGNVEESKGSVSLFLYFRSFQSENVAQVTVDYQLTIVNEQNYSQATPKGQNRIHERGGTETFKGPEDHWGWTKFVRHDILKDPKYCISTDDTLTVLCEITFHDQDVAEKVNDYDNLIYNIGKGFEDYEKLLETNYFCDVTFAIQGFKMHLHKAILMCRSPVFKAMFDQGMQEKEVEIKDVNYEIMKELFRFIYSGKVQNIETIAKDLIVVADKYSVRDLKALCEKTLYVNLTIDNAIECLKLSNVCETIHLKALVIKFIAAHYKILVKKPEFADLSRNVMYQIILAIADKD